MELDIDFSGITINDTNNNNKVVLDSSSIILSGNCILGMGTTNPTAKLHIATPDSVVTTTSVLNFKNTSDYGIYAESDSISGRGNTLDFKSRDYNVNNNNIRNILSLRPEGNVGIGTTNPACKLHVKDTGGEGKIIIENESLALLQLKQPTSNKTYNIELGRTDGELSFRSTTGEKLRIKENGNVGIGTTNPLCSLYNFSSATSGWAAQSYFGNGTTGVIAGTYNNVAYIGGHNGSLSAWTNLAINPSGGKVGIGTTNPICPLHINGYNELGSSGWPTIGAGSAGTFHYFLRASNHAGHTHWVTDNRIEQSSGTYSWSNPNGISLSTISRLSIFCENVIRAQYYVAPSDNRIKTDISLINDETALNQVNAIETHEYHYIDPIRRNPIKTIGFIAQEVKNVIPNAVGLITDTVPDELRIVENPIWIDCSYCSIRYEPKTTYTETVTYEEGQLLDSSGNPVLDQSGNQIMDPSAIQIVDPSGIEHIDPSGIVIEVWHPKWKLQIPDLDMSSNNTGRCRFYFSNDPSGNDEIMKELSLDISSNDTFEAIDTCYNNVFFYGKEVDDFHTLDKAQIFSLHHSAIQELSRKNDKIVEEINTLKEENTILKQTNTEILERLNEIEAILINSQNN